ncbi:hypothetical protein J2Z75_005221 [Rhizobium herbae]|uniref:Uncharacterized protein n=1 Tax=Rhizobium herbae TaxID=508661 RepID=A0ABS4EUT3_9HYPH|nr:hypothetical protein [Rhizobium herbae]
MGSCVGGNFALIPSEFSEMPSGVSMRRDAEGISHTGKGVNSLEKLAPWNETE